MFDYVCISFSIIIYMYICMKNTPSSITIKINYRLPSANIYKIMFFHGNVNSLRRFHITNDHLFVYTRDHEPPEGQKERQTIYVQQHLTLSGSDTFLIWTFPQVRNRPLWSLRVRVKHAQRIARRCAPERVLLFRARCEFAHSYITRGQGIRDGARAKR